MSAKISALAREFATPRLIERKMARVVEGGEVEGGEVVHTKSMGDSRFKFET